MEVTISIPDDLAKEFGNDLEELRQRLHLELAVQSYRDGLASFGRAAELAGLPQRDFEQVLAERKVDRNYNADDLRADLEFARTGIPGKSAQTST